MLICLAAHCRGGRPLGLERLLAILIDSFIDSFITICPSGDILSRRGLERLLAILIDSFIDSFITICPLGDILSRRVLPGGGRPFGLERLLAIFYSILIDPVRPTAELLSQIR